MNCQKPSLGCDDRRDEAALGLVPKLIWQAEDKSLVCGLCACPSHKSWPVSLPPRKSLFVLPSVYQFFCSSGIWYDVLETLASLSVLTNGCIIAFTTDFIPRWVYRQSHNMTLEGYLTDSLSAFNTSDYARFDPKAQPDNMTINGTVPPVCYYRDYRQPPGGPDEYDLSTTYWHVYAAKFIFVVLFQNVVMWTRNVIAWLIPDMPKALRNLMKRENYITNEVVMHHELERARRVGGEATGDVGGCGLLVSW
jgi:hypothetical protein